MRILILITLLSTTSLYLFAQDTSSVRLGAYADGYYSWYSNGDRTIYQESDVIGAYHNNFGLNVAQFTGAYDGNRARGALTAHFGDIPAIAWSNNYRFIQEANAGVRLAERLWLDIGFFKTHVGTESFLPKDNMLSIVTLGTFYGPFYQSGARLSYNTKSNWHVELHAINGYNRHIDNNEYKSYGALISKQWNDLLYTSYSNLVGQEQIGGTTNDAYLVYQNAYATVEGERWSVQAGIDVANSFDWRVKDDWEDKLLIAALLTAQYRWNEQFATTARFELFSDERQINSFQTQYIQSGNQVIAVQDGMTVFGPTAGIAFTPSEHAFLRLESRYLFDPAFPANRHAADFNSIPGRGNPMLQERVQLMITAGFYFDKSFKFAP
jgi:hypothetical protein